MADYLNKAISFAENAAKLSQKVSAGLVENARELGLESGSNYFDTSEERISDIRRQLESGNNREKLEGMKRLIAMISKGRDVSEFFPSVVKNVASQSHSLRKLVYIYLLRYAEQEPDLALLSINTFQKDLSDQNAIIRAMALRVMSGIRVPVIAPIVVLGIKKCVTDMSPYVRKTAATAIPKCWSLDPTQESELLDILTTLLNDTSTITIGSVLMAFNEVCPDRWDLIHPHYRKLCRMLGDADEWGQMAILNVLARYARTQFLNPNSQTIKTTRHRKKNGDAFYSEEEQDSDATSGEEDVVYESAALDEDHQLLLMCCAPLLQSRNSGVVLVVAKIFFQLAPAAEATKIGKPLVRVLRSRNETQYGILTNVAVMAYKRPDIFEPHLNQFFVSPSDPSFIRSEKLEVLVLLANPINISILLRELQEYVKSPHQDLVVQTIEAIGACAMRVPEVADRCLAGLMKLLTSHDDIVVAESVITIKRLLQLRPTDNESSIISLAKTFDAIKVPMARASILWLIGQYSAQLEKVAPDVLRKAVKTFAEETAVTKLQILNLAAKLHVTQSQHQTITLLLRYVLDLARYDLDYDVRDRARFLRGLMMHFDNANGEAMEAAEGQQQGEGLRERVKDILLCDKDVPILETPAAGREEYTIGSLSLLLSHPLPGYEPLPDYPLEQPDPSVRIPPTPPASQYQSRTKLGIDLEKGFGSDSFEARYRGMGGGAMTGELARHGIEQALSSIPRAKKKGDEYDLDAFYNESSEESEEETEEEDEDDEDEDDDEEDEDEDEEDEDEEEDSDEESEEDENEEEETSSDEEGVPITESSRMMRPY